MKHGFASIIRFSTIKVRNGITLIALAGLVGGCSAGDKKTAASLPLPMSAVFDNYFAIQKDLAHDSMKEVSVRANSIVQFAGGAEAKAVPDGISAHADALARAKDLKQAREAFKPLSDDLAAYLRTNKSSAGIFHEAYCPMANASWVQPGKEIQNPTAVPQIWAKKVLV